MESGSGDFGGDQALGLEFLPQGGRNLVLEHRDVVIYLFHRTAADKHRGHRRMSERKLHRCGPEWNSVAGTNIANALGAVDEVRRRGPVVVISARLRIRKDAAVVDATGDDRNAALETLGQQLLQPDLVEQRISAGEEEAVEIAFAGEAGYDLHPDRSVGAAVFYTVGPDTRPAW